MITRVGMIRIAVRYIVISMMLVLIGCGLVDTVKESWEESGREIDRKNEEAEWSRAGFFPISANEWRRFGFTIEEARSWKDYDYSVSPAEAQEWKNSGFAIVEVAGWRNAGIKPSQASQWKNVGYTPTEAGKWKEHSIYAAEAIDWRAAGYAPSQAGEWKNAGFNSSEAIEWGSSGFSAQDAKEWSLAKFTNSEAMEWREARFNPVESIKWKDLGFTSVEAAEWREYVEIELSSVIVYGGQSESRRTLAKGWKDAGFKPKEAIELEAHDLEAGQAKEWIEAGYTSVEAGIWAKSGLSISQAAAWKAAGLKVSDIETAKLALADFNDPQDVKKKIKKLRADCPGGVGTIGDLAYSNPYEIKGKCFNIMATQLQLLSKSQALFNLDTFVFYVDFGNASVPQVMQGIVKGMGEYQYLTAIGTRKIVPKVKVVVFDKLM